MDIRNSIVSKFIACSCSKTPHSADWNQKNGWILFGSSRNVALISQESPNKASIITSTYCEHDGDVTCVKWITAKRDSEIVSSYAISGATDSRVVLWRFDEASGTLCKLGIGVGHSMVITHVNGLELDHSILCCSCSADSTLRIWKKSIKKDSDMELLQTISVDHSGFALCADMHRMDKGVILASGYDDKKIRLFWQSDINQNFVQVIVLSGHEDWIRDLNFQVTSKSSTNPTDESIAFATCSQDSFVRLWRISTLSNITNENSPADKSNANEIKLKRQLFSVETNEKKTVVYTAGLEAILSGHEDWVYSVRWHPAGISSLLTASMDKCLVIWELDNASGLWVSKTRLGVVGGPVASGFYGGLFGPNGKSVLGHSFQGGFHVWNQQEEGWIPAITPSGHFGVVEDVCWDINGHYLLSCSADQTTRLFGPWIREDKAVTVHEIARPQVHGYDMQCLATVSSSCFVSGAEEKILRSFTSTKTFAGNFIRITNVSAQKAVELNEILCDPSLVADGATVSALGLSNKAMFTGDMAKETGTTALSIPDDEEASGDVASNVAFQPQELRAPPTEDCLMQSTLWPEVHKLYGHGCEVFTVACNHAGTVIASAAKATKPEQAQVILWSTADWQQRSQLGGHSLTVTQIAFSPDDCYLLTVSRDRTWCLHKKQNDDFNWTLVAYTDKKTAMHARIIWSCAWSPDSKYFVTASRDKKVIMWKLTDENTGTSTGNVRHQTVLDTPDSATAVAVCTKMLTIDSYLVAVGLESGEIHLHRWNSANHQFFKLFELNKNMAHALTVKRLRFRPQVDGDWIPSKDFDSERNIVYLASCSDDHSVKIFKINLNAFTS